MDDPELRNKDTALMRLALPYLAITLCLGVALWLTWSHLL
jgi:hypothetical protein